MIDHKTDVLPIFYLFFFIKGQAQARAQVLWPIAHTLKKEGAGDDSLTDERESAWGVESKWAGSSGQVSGTTCLK